MKNKPVNSDLDAQSRERTVFEFGPFKVDPAERQLLRKGTPVPLTAKAFDTLLLLVQRSNHLVEKSEIMRTIWPDSFVEESNLSVNVWMLRKALGGNDECKYIQTVAKRGYRFVADVKETQPSLIDGSRSDSAERGAPDDPVPNPTPIKELLFPADAVAAGTFAAPVVRWFRFSAARPVALICLLAFVMLSAAFTVFHYRSISYAASSIHSLAVLPFQTLNSGKGQEYLGLDITDAVITKLGSSGRMRVLPTSAILQYSNHNDDPRTIGRVQKVDAVLVGSLEQQSDRVRVNVQLVRVADGAMLWAQTFDEQPDRMFALEDAVAKGIDNLGSIPALATVKNTPVPEDSRNRKAYQLYLEGRYFWNKRTEDGLRRSIELFQQATMEDDQYAEAYAGLADSYALLGSYGVEPAQRAYPNAKAAALKALELDSSLAEAHSSQGMIAFYYGWNWDEAEQEFRRSLAINPDYATTHTWYAVSLVALGRNEEALAQVRKAEELDPMSLIINTEVGRVFYLTRQYDQAIEAYRKVIDLDPQFARAHSRLGMVYAAKGDFPNAIGEFEKAKALSTDPYLDGLIGYAQASSGNTASARLTLKELTERSHREYVPSFSIALIRIGLGDRDQALDLLTKSYQDRSTYMVYAKVDPLLDSIRSDPRFAVLLHRMKLA
jgi:DNA-binding winged helix-turn-helix (wHTH) protein/TolB-like protein/Flp pilus assembly protein TadD